MTEQTRPDAADGAAARPEAEPATEADAATEAAEPEAPDEEDPGTRIAALEAERDELKDRVLRVYAEMENLRKRAERDVKDAQAYAGTKLARDLLGVHDNLGRALEATDDAVREVAGPLVEGVELTHRELLSAFHKHSIEPVVPEIGSRFDPKLHEAMFEAPVADAKPGTVIQVMEKGFTISGRLLRPARVGVAAAQPDQG
ncbi:MAG TPA: nucleotide exchange factor GrpE [Paracoccaceae bacterium]|nr:nucleotide exchange factor GrpE [Paracoccaceae bacterium]